jgi:hypothetical protein
MEPRSPPARGGGDSHTFEGHRTEKPGIRGAVVLGVLRSIALACSGGRGGGRAQTPSTVPLLMESDCEAQL